MAARGAPAAPKPRNTIKCEQLLSMANRISHVLSLFFHCVCTGPRMTVRVMSPEPSLTLMVRVSPGETFCKFGGRVWCIEWSGGTAPVKLTTLQTVRDFASGAVDPRLGTRRLTIPVKLGKKVVVVSELGPMRSKLTFTLEVQVGSGGDPIRRRATPRSTSAETLRGVLIFRDQVLCTNDRPDVPGIVPDWRAVDEEAYANPTTGSAVVPTVAV